MGAYKRAHEQDKYFSAYLPLQSSTTDSFHKCGLNFTKNILVGVPNLNSSSLIQCLNVYTVCDHHPALDDSNN